MEKQDKIMPNGGISDFELDQLKEVMNIGVSHSSTALSKMLNRRVTISVPEVILDEIDNVSSYIGDTERLTTAVLLNVSGDTEGIMSIIFPNNNKGSVVSDVIRLVADKEVDNEEELSAYDASIVKEVGNILIGASLTSLSKFLNLDLKQSLSEVVTDMLGSIINSVMVELGKDSEVALIVKVVFNVEEENLSPEFYLFISPKTSAVILEATKKKLS